MSRCGYVKVNVDGARNNQGLSGCGGIIRDASRRWIIDFTKFVGCGSVLNAELWGIFEGINMALQQGFMHVEVESDSKKAVDILCRSGEQCYGSANLVHRIRELITKFTSYNLKHVFREANVYANDLARVGIGVQGRLKVFASIPPFLLKNFENDFRGVSSSRIIGV